MLSSVLFRSDRPQPTGMTKALDAAQNVLSRLQELALQHPLVAWLHFSVGTAGTLQRLPLQPLKPWDPLLYLLQ